MIYFIRPNINKLDKNWAMEKCQRIGSYKRTPEFVSIDSRVANTICYLVTSVEQLKSGANCLTPDGETFQLFHPNQITIIMDPARG